MGIVRDLFYAKKMSAGQKLPAPSSAVFLKRKFLANNMGGEKTYSGPVVSFIGRANTEILALTATIAPVQDLHGYSSPWIGDEHNAVLYNFRAVSDAGVSQYGNSELGSIVGGTVAWNQLVRNGNFASTSGWTSESGVSFSVANNVASISTTSANNGITRGVTMMKGHKYFVSFDAKGSASGSFKLVIVNSTVLSLIASVTASKMRFSAVKSYSNTSGNQTLYLFPTDTANTYSISNVMLVDLTQMFGSTIADYIYSLEQNTAGAGVAWFRKLFPKDYYAYDVGSLQSVQTSAHKTYKADSTLLGNYALDDSIVLRGIPKLDANNSLYYDGDGYAPDGTVTRRYAVRAYEEGDATDGSTMITDGTNTVYKLTTHTTEPADPYTNPQSIDPDGTEEYVDAGVAAGTRDVAIPVGHDTVYANICPITGWTGANAYVSPTQDVADATVYPVTWQTEAGTVYGGTVDVVTGVLTVDRANIASYNGETITEPWISSMDAYVAGATPTTGAQVVYTLATPVTYQLTPQEVTALVGQNYVWGDTGDVTVTVIH